MLQFTVMASEATDDVKFLKQQLYRMQQEMAAVKDEMQHQVIML